MSKKKMFGKDPATNSSNGYSLGMCDTRLLFFTKDADYH